MYLLLHKCSCLANLFFAFFVVVVVTFLLFHFGYLQKLFADIYLSFSKNISVDITPKLNLKDVHKMYGTSYKRLMYILLRENYSYSKLFWSAFSRIRTE